MKILILLIGIFLILILSKIEMNKTEKIIITIIITFYSTILFISTFNPYKLYAVSTYTYFLWIICMAMLALGYCVRYKKVGDDRTKNKLSIDKIINNRLLIIIGCALTIALFYFKIKYDNLAENLQSAAELRLVRFTTLFNSYAEYIIFEYIISASTSIFTVFFCVLFVEKKFKTKLFWISLIDIVLYIMIGYGRKKLLDIIVYIIVYFIIKKEGNINISIKNCIKTISIGLVIFVMSVSVTAIREGVKLNRYNKIATDIAEEQIKQYYIYFLGGFRSLDKFVNEFDNNYTWGRLTLAGIDDIISIPFAALGYNYNTINAQIGKKLQSNISIGDKLYMNAFYTCVMNFYSDFGLLGVIIIPLIYGMILKRIVGRGIEQKNFFDMTICLYIVSTTISAIYKWFYQSGPTLFTILLMILLKEILIKRDGGHNWNMKHIENQ